MMSLSDFLMLRSKEQGILFYPGSGADYGPFNLFSVHEQITTAIYVDYAIGKKYAQYFLANIPDWAELPMSSEEVKPVYLGVEDWKACWPDQAEAHRFAQPHDAFGLRSRVANQATQVELVFLATEAVQTYSLLLRRNIVPSIVVLHDHGFGGNWTRFGGSSPLYLAACEQSLLPNLLLVAKGTIPWPGYLRVSDYAEMLGQRHNQLRAVFVQA